jgi:hypothetical protein
MIITEKPYFTAINAALSLHALLNQQPNISSKYMWNPSIWVLDTSVNNVVSNLSKILISMFIRKNSIRKYHIIVISVTILVLVNTA